MNKEEKIISLPLAKELQQVAKENGFELPESEYIWWHPCGENGKTKPEIIKRTEETMHRFLYFAYDTSELGMILPDGMQSNRIDNKDGTIDWHSWAMNFKHSFFGKTEAECRGKMFCYLISNKLI